MKNVKINGKDRLAFIVKDGAAATIVIPIDILAPIDYQRLIVLEAKGGELMRAMKDENMGNGMNCLTQYQSLLIVVPKVQPVTEQAAVTKDTLSEVKPAQKKRGPKPKPKVISTDNSIGTVE